MSREEWTEDEKAQLRADALQYIIPHFASNAELAKGPKIFVRGEGCYVWDLEGRRYFDSFATLLTTVSGHVRPEVTQAVAEQMITACTSLDYPPDRAAVVVITTDRETTARAVQRRYLLNLAAAPVLPLVKWERTIAAFLARSPDVLRRRPLALAILLMGLYTWGTGFVAGAFGPPLRWSAG